MLMHEVMFTCVEARRNAASVHESENEPLFTRLGLVTLVPHDVVSLRLMEP
jgi:hypothetical protein